MDSCATQRTTIYARLFSHRAPFEIRFVSLVFRVRPRRWCIVFLLSLSLSLSLCFSSRPGDPVVTPYARARRRESVSFSSFASADGACHGEKTGPDVARSLLSLLVRLTVRAPARRRVRFSARVTAFFPLIPSSFARPFGTVRARRSGSSGIRRSVIPAVSDSSRRRIIKATTRRMRAIAHRRGWHPPPLDRMPFGMLRRFRVSRPFRALSRRILRATSERFGILRDER